MKRLPIMFVSAALAVGVAAGAQQSNATSTSSQDPQVNTRQNVSGTSPREQARDQNRISREVRHELLMLPYYSVFDDLRYSVQGNTVVLYGDVVNATLKGDSEKVVKKIEGVERVDNRINILPPSPNDDRIRRQMIRAIYGTDGLDRYSWSAVPSIHIIVNGGHVKLTGVVDSDTDKDLAGVKANGVPGVFSVENDLQVVNNSNKIAQK